MPLLKNPWPICRPTTRNRTTIGENGLLNPLTKLLVEKAFDVELAEHLGRGGGGAYSYALTRRSIVPSSFID